MKSLIQWLMFVLFIALSIIILVSSVVVLWNQPQRPVLVQAPKPPTPPQPFRDGTFETNALSVYQQQVTAYKENVTAYCAYNDAVNKSDVGAAYSLVVKDTIGTFFGQIVLAFLGFAFLKSGANTIDNLFRSKLGQPPQPFKLLD